LFYYYFYCRPLNSFNFSGDAIYGTGLVAALLSLIIALVKYNSAEVLKSPKSRQSKVPKPNDYSSPTHPTHSTAAQNSNAPSSFSFAPTSIVHDSHIQPIRDFLTLLSDSHRVDLRNDNASAAVETRFHSASATPLSSAQVQPALITHTVRQVNEVANYREKAFCGCQKGKCISGNCKCHRARRACTPLCHGGKPNIKCEATIDRVYE